MKGFMKIALIVFIVAMTMLSLFACARPEYTVTFVHGDGREDVVATVQSGNQLYIPEPTADDLVFGGWYLDAELTQPFLTSKLTSDITLYARFIKKGESTVTFVYDDNGVTPSTTIVFTGTIPEPKDPIREGYVFVGWKDGTTGEYYDFDTPPESNHTTLTAVWLVAGAAPSFTVDLQDGSTPKTTVYKFNAKPIKPQAPVRRGYVFYGWFSDKECTEIFDFSRPLTKSVTVYAGWVKDVGELGNIVADEILLSSVEVNGIHTKQQGFFNTVTARSIGSGVIYKATANRYYVLTNQHVVDGDGYTSSSYIIFDAYGNEYAATLHAHSAAYDLALLSFEKTDTVLSVATLAAENPEVGDMLVSVGNPGSLNNVVTFGEMLRYQVASVEGGAVSFKVGWHNCPIKQGSSGGPVFNSDLHLVGINFAASVDDDKNFLYGAFIQIERVIEFITDCESKLMLS